MPRPRPRRSSSWKGPKGRKGIESRKRSRKMATPAEAKVPNGGKEQEGANVDKIRDILFGSQMRDYEKRFARLEENVNKAVDSLREDVAKRFDTLSGYVQQETE